MAWDDSSTVVWPSATEPSRRCMSPSRDGIKRGERLVEQ